MDLLIDWHAVTKMYNRATRASYGITTDSCHAASKQLCLKLATVVRRTSTMVQSLLTNVSYKAFICCAAACLSPFVSNPSTACIAYTTEQASIVFLDTCAPFLISCTLPLKVNSQ